MLSSYGLNERKAFLLIRHAKTEENLQRRYASELDVPLCDTGVKEAAALAQSGVLPPVDALFCAPALRCLKTAEILFPDIPVEICAFAEINFGIFAGKSADDLRHDNDYKKWLAANCTGDISGGDSVTAFKQRSRAEFLRIAEINAKTAALIIHGGNIMAIMESLAVPKKDFFEYRTPNCGFFLCRYENGALRVQKSGGKL